MTQSRLASAVEAVANIVVGYVVSVIANCVVLPMFGYSVSLRDSMAIGAAFTVISLARSYAIRRLFNAISL